MMSFSNTIVDSMLDHFFGLASWTAPAAIWVGLSSTEPAADGTNVTVPTWTSYARVNSGIGSDNWTRTAESVVNDNTIEFAEIDDDTDTPAYFTLYTASSGGTFLGSGALDTPAAKGPGETPRFPAGTLEATLA